MNKASLSEMTTGLETDAEAVPVQPTWRAWDCAELQSISGCAKAVFQSRVRSVPVARFGSKPRSMTGSVLLSNAPTRYVRTRPEFRDDHGLRPVTARINARCPASRKALRLSGIRQPLRAGSRRPYGAVRFAVFASHQASDPLRVGGGWQ